MTKNFAFNYKSPVKIVLPYVIFSGLYIFCSDYIVKTIAPSVHTLSQLQTAKGLGFIIITAILLFILVDSHKKMIVGYYEDLLVEQKKAEEERHASEEKYWALFNLSPLPMWIYDINDLRFLLVNEAACAKYGYSKEEFYRRSIVDIRPKEDVPQLMNAIGQARNTTRKAWSTTYRHQVKDGAIINVKIESIGVPFENKTARMVIATDVTQELSTQQQLIEVNSKLTAASAIANIGYWSNDFATGKIYWSDMLYKIFGLDPATFELTLPNIQSRFHPRHNEEFARYDEEFRNSDTNEYERCIITPDGSEKWIAERLHLIRNGQGIPVKMEGVAVDITERKLAQQAIQESNERFQMVARAAIEAIVDWNIVTNEIFWGDGFRKFFGHNPQSKDRLLWTKNIHPDDRKLVIDSLNKALSDKTRENLDIEFRFIKANGEIAYVQHRFIFIRDTTGKAVRAIGAMIDVTESMEKLRRIEKQNEQLREIAWVQSHVVRAPLARLLGLTTLLKDKDAYAIDETETIDDIIASAHSLDTVIHDIVKRTEMAEL